MTLRVFDPPAGIVKAARGCVVMVGWARPVPRTTDKPSNATTAVLKDRFIVVERQ